MTSKRCPNCDTTLPEGAGLCPRCGAGASRSPAIGIIVIIIGLLFFMVAFLEPWMWITAAFLIPVILYAYYAFTGE